MKKLLIFLFLLSCAGCATYNERGERIIFVNPKELHEKEFHQAPYNR